MTKISRAAAARAGWRGRVAGSAMALALAVIAAGGAAPTASAAPAAPAPAGPALAGRAQAGPVTPLGTSCRQASGPFTVQGTQVLDQAGNPFVSYGITVPGLQWLDWRNFTGQDLEKITAIADDWCANTVRLQVSQDNLLGVDGTGFNQAFMSAIKAEVALAESYHMVVVINDQSEFGGPVAASTQRGPTAASMTFWQDMTRLYGHDPQVIFDLFNEPRTFSAGMSQAQEWRLWLDGGWFGGTFYPFGMAKLAAYVRSTLGAQNLFWVEGPNMAESLAGMVSQGALLNVSGIVYAVHHPAAPHDAASWDADFGYLVRMGIAPVVDGEWTNYEPPPTEKLMPLHTSCWPDAPTTVPQFLGYLAAYGISLNAYQLQPGYLIKSYRDMADPTTIDGRTWNCQSNQEPQPGQGTGALLMAWFEEQNG